MPMCWRFSTLKASTPKTWQLSSGQLPRLMCRRSFAASAGTGIG